MRCHTRCVRGHAGGHTRGRTLACPSPRACLPLTERVAGGACHVDAGQETDATAMARCLEERRVMCRACSRPPSVLDTA
jgi:hypothetical protein